MKEEILRFEHVTLQDGQETVLDNLNFYILKGEIMALIALRDKGKREFLLLMSQNLSIDYGKIYYDGKQVNSYTHSDQTMNKVSLIQEKSGLIDSLSIADNIFVMRKGFKKYMIKERTLEAQVIRFMEELGVSMNFARKVSSISQRERVVIEIAKAILSGHRLIIMDNISNFVNQSQLAAVFKLIRELKKRGISFLYVCNHHEEGFRIADRGLLFMDGRIHKVLETDELTDRNIKPYIIPFPTSHFNRIFEEGDYILGLHHVRCGHMRDLSFSLKRGECLTVIDMDNKIPVELTALLTGQTEVEEGCLEFDGNLYGKIEAREFIDRGLVVIPPEPVERYLFYEMSYMENLTFLLDRKIGKNCIKNAYIKSIRREYEPLVGTCINVGDIRTLDKKELYSLVYYRIRLYHPKLVVLIQPVAHGDMYCRKHILDLIQSFRDMGISILILTNSVSDNLTVSDRLLIIKKGEVMAEYHENQFDQISK